MGLTLPPMTPGLTLTRLSTQFDSIHGSLDELVADLLGEHPLGRCVFYDSRFQATLDICPLPGLRRGRFFNNFV